MYLLNLNNGYVCTLKATDMKGVELEAVAMCVKMNRGGSVHMHSTNNPQIAIIGWNGVRFQMQAGDLHCD
jgi:hypothetical protein